MHEKGISTFFILNVEEGKTDLKTKNITLLHTGLRSFLQLPIYYHVLAYIVNNMKIS